MSELTLYELNERERQFLDLVASGEIDPETAKDTLEALGEAINKKGENIIHYDRNLGMWEDALTNEEKQIKERKKVVSNRRKNFRDRIKYVMEFFNIKKIEVPQGYIRIQGNPESLQINDESKIPGKYLTIIPERTEPNKEAIKAALMAGEKVEGCELIRGNHIRIK